VTKEQSDRQTNRQIQRHSIYHANMASHDKNVLKSLTSYTT